MAQILVRGLDAPTVEHLKRRAHRAGRSLQAEAKLILEHAGAVDVESAHRLADRIRAKLKGRRLSDSADLVRQDRDR